MYSGKFVKYPLEFIRPSGTSRGVLTTKTCYILKIWDTENPSVFGLGEVSIIEGLSIDNPQKLEEKLLWLTQNLHLSKEEIYILLLDFPAIRMAYEMAILDLSNGGERIFFKSHFAKGFQKLNINGLIWMGDKSYMLQQIEEKIAQGFKCLKLKIGAINFKDEVEIIRSVRERYCEETLEIRVDANGAFSVDEALPKLEILSQLDLHSIEQPIRQGQWQEMALLCEKTPLDIALDEELIGIHAPEEKQRLLETIQPQYIILKPSLLGGFQASMEWIQESGTLSIPWWITSALESNLGLAAIAQFVSQFYNPLPQGLGTGQLYQSNLDCPLVLNGQELTYDTSKNWNLDALKW